GLVPALLDDRVRVAVLLLVLGGRRLRRRLLPGPRVALGGRLLGRLVVGQGAGREHGLALRAADLLPRGDRLGAAQDGFALGALVFRHRRTFGRAGLFGPCHCTVPARLLPDADYGRLPKNLDRELPARLPPVRPNGLAE